MKKKTIIKVLSGVLCLTIMMSVTAFAGTTDIKLDSSAAVDKVSVTEEEQQQYTIEEGTVTSVENKGEYYRLEITNDNMGMIFNIKDKAFVIDQKSNKRLTVKEIKKDMKLAAILPTNAAMTLSIPAQTSAAVGFIIKSNEGSFDMSLYNSDLVNAKNTLKLNISDNTQIVDAQGSKRLYSAEDIKNSECVVLYTIATRSIPAQTLPEMVIILDKRQQKETVDSKYIALREAAEGKGYKVQWTSNEKPIVLTKNDMTVEITIGSDGLKFTHLTKDIKALDRINKMDLPVVLENGQTMVSDSFITALE